MAHAWKACIRQRIEGSNPFLSAKSFFSFEIVSKACFRKQGRMKKEKQKFHFCFKDFGQRELVGCWSGATAIHFVRMTMLRIGNPVEHAKRLFQRDTQG